MSRSSPVFRSSSGLRETASVRRRRLPPPSRKGRARTRERRHPHRTSSRAAGQETGTGLQPRRRSPIQPLLDVVHRLLALSPPANASGDSKPASGPEVTDSGCNVGAKHDLSMTSIALAAVGLGFARRRRNTRSRRSVSSYSAAWTDHRRQPRAGAPTFLLLHDVLGRAEPLRTSRRRLPARRSKSGVRFSDEPIFS
jgi:hypothetical protein